MDRQVYLAIAQRLLELTREGAFPPDCRERLIERAIAGSLDNNGLNGQLGPAPGEGFLNGVGLPAGQLGGPRCYYRLL